MPIYLVILGHFIGCTQDVMELKNLISESYSYIRYQIYSIVGKIDDVLLELLSLEVFQTEKGTPSLDLIDILDLSR